MKALKCCYNTLKKLDFWIFVPFFILSVIGIIMVYSASSDIAIQNGGNPIEYLIKQTIYFLFSIVIIIFIFHFHYIRNKKFLGIFCIVLFAMLIFLKLHGKTINGAAGWISFFGLFNIQPSEITKFFLIIVFANHIDNHQNEIVNHWLRNMGNVLSISLIACALIFIQPDIGGASINAVIVFAMLLLSGIRWQKALIIFISIFMVIFIVFWTVLVPISKTSQIYSLKRILAFTSPFTHSQGIGQQLVNSYYALSNGGLFGVGLGNSIQKNGYLPEPNTDFIMSIIAEELGLVMVLVILTLLAIMIFRIVKIGIQSDTAYSALVCYGTATYLTIQTFFNVGGVTGMLPITGVAFPFISYGGSSMFTLSLCLGLVFRINYHQKMNRNKLKEG